MYGSLTLLRGAHKLLVILVRVEEGDEGRDVNERSHIYC